MSTARVLALLELLQAGGTRRVGDLAERLGVDERTVRRYAEHLAELDIPVRSVRGRYGGYRLAPGFRMPPLMLTDDEAVAVAIGLHAGPDSLAADNALSKLRRVLPAQLADRLGAFLETASFTTPQRPAPADTGVLLTIAQAARDQLSVDITYTDRLGQTTSRRIKPYGVVGHGDRWYVATADRTFRLDRIAKASLPKATASGRGGKPAPAEQGAEAGRGPEARDGDPAGAVLHALATTPWAHHVSVRVQATVEVLQRRLPPGLAVLTPLKNEVRVELRAERLDWVPALLAGLDLPFVIEAPDELHEHVRQLAERLRRIAGGPVDVGL
ncbi:YafY family protein [Kribbella sp. NPDC005582]|uniref:helix-turn-helix transcriptional regulator n=1 Tax=Kribbella sp. NPDC005582 TaxID=3156893 RepID=UPI0033A5D99A